MEASEPRFCKKCGALLPLDGDFCESCGAQKSAPADSPKTSQAPPGDISTPDEPVAETLPVVDTGPSFSGGESSGTTNGPFKSGHLEDHFNESVLPDTAVTPRIGRALTIGWDLLVQDFWGGVLIALCYFLVIVGISFVLPGISYFLAIPLMVGFFGWAEERRRGFRSNPGTLFRIGANRFSDSLLLSLVYLVISLIVALPAVAAEIFFIIFMAATIIGTAAADDSISALKTILMFPIVIFFLYSWLVLFFTIIGPILFSWQSMASWAIANGKPFSEAINWAWERIRSRFFAWWLAGLVMGFLSGIGAILCYIGIFISVPWIQLAIAELVGDMGDTRSKKQTVETTENT